LTGVSPNFDMSWEFLQRVHPGRPFVVTGIGFAEKKLPTRTFGPSDREEFIQWATAAGPDCNLYWHVGEPMGQMHKKMERTDIRAVHFLHVDVDPVKGKPIDEERARILALLRDPPGIPPPTCITFSGGGYQALWKLTEPIVIDGDLSKAEDAKLYNIHLENVLGGDNCHDVSRILRLPGSVNVPNEKKRKNGQAEMLAEVVEWHNARVYDISQFPKGTLAGSVPRKESKPTSAKVDRANVRRLGHVDQLGPGVGEKCKQCIVNGYVPDDPKGVAPGSLDHFPSRSERLLWVCCELVRAGIEDDIIYSIITDDQFKISESVLEKKSGSERYALRQIERAKDEALDDPVSKINRRYFAATEGSRTMFYREEDDGAVTPMNAEAFAFELAPETVDVQDAKGNTKKVEAVRLWKSSTRRRYYPRGFCLDPSYQRDEGRYNLWRGFGVPEVRGDWSLIERHIYEVLADRNTDHGDYIKKWTAWKLQNPEGRPRVALAFRGDEGVGKGFYHNGMVTIFGTHGLRVHSMNQVSGRFNAHLRHLCYLFADEVTVADDDQEGALKGIITEADLPIEGKGKDVLRAPNHLAVGMASNKRWMVPAGIGARRFAVFDVSPRYKGKEDYFSKLFAQAGRGGWSAMLFDLRRMDLEDWHPEANRPTTQALRDQQVESLGGLEGVVADMLLTGEVPSGLHRGERLFVPTLALCEHVARRTRGEQPTAREVQLLFTRLGFEKDDTARPRGWVLPRLADARAAWDRAQVAMQWPEVDGWSVGVHDYAAGAAERGGTDAF
jgi:Family of unknown function (DUF5906)